MTKMAGGLGGLGGRPELTPLMGDELVRLAQMRRGAAMEEYRPSIRDRIGNAIYDAVGGLGGVRNRMRGEAQVIADLLPGVGDAIAVEDAGNLIGNGEWADAAIGAGLLVLGMAPIGGKVASKGLKKLASRSQNIYDPPMKPPRPFEADYPVGGMADDAGKLTGSIEGTPLSARYVVGRGQVSGPDMALPREALDEIAKARTGEAIRTVAPRSGELGRDVGRAAFRRSGEPDYVAVSSSLTPEQNARVAAHEIAHVIDKTAGEIPASGLNSELRTIYNDLNNPQSYGKPFGPEQNRYRDGDVRHELMAEAIRAYMTDPNYIKTVAPKTASRIREYVNGHPQLKDIIQFNSLAAFGGGAALMSGNEDF